MWRFVLSGLWDSLPKKYNGPTRTVSQPTLPYPIPQLLNNDLNIQMVGRSARLSKSKYSPALTREVWLDQIMHRKIIINVVPPESPWPAAPHLILIADF